MIFLMISYSVESKEITVIDSFTHVCNYTLAHSLLWPTLWYMQLATINKNLNYKKEDHNKD